MVAKLHSIYRVMLRWVVFSVGWKRKVSIVRKPVQYDYSKTAAIFKWILLFCREAAYLNLNSLLLHVPETCLVGGVVVGFLSFDSRVVVGASRKIQCQVTMLTTANLADCEPCYWMITSHKTFVNVLI